MFSTYPSIEHVLMAYESDSVTIDYVTVNSFDNNDDRCNVTFIDKQGRMLLDKAMSKRDFALLYENTPKNWYVFNP